MFAWLYCTFKLFAHVLHFVSLLMILCSCAKFSASSLLRMRSWRDRKLNLLILKLNSVMVSYFNEEFILHQSYFRNHSILIKIQIIVVRRVEYKKDNINRRLVLRFTELANKQKCNVNASAFDRLALA